jgi:hypothetical protein
MRSDMGKCVIEAPRHGSANPSAKARWYGKICVDEEGRPDYDGLTRLPSSRKQEGYHPQIGDKSFSDVLGPIERYLHSSVGRRWDDVYSELSRNLGRGPWPLRHVLTQHVHVATNTYRGVDGRIWSMGRRGPEVVDGGYGVEFYVDPKSRTLQRQVRIRRQMRKPEQAERVELKDGRWLIRIDGLWFIGRYQPAEPPLPVHAKWPDIRSRAGILRFVKEKSANRREMRAGLGAESR